MVIRESGEGLDVSGSPVELVEVADRIDRLDAGRMLEVQADVAADPHPYDRCLSGLSVRRTEGPARVSVAGGRAIVTGGGPALHAFASYFRFEPNAPPGAHGHHEWYEGHPHIHPQSIPVVIGVDFER